MANREFCCSDRVFLVTGGAGFIGSHLCETILYNSGRVRCLDNLSTGKRDNIAPFLSNPCFEFIEGDICDYDTCLKVWILCFTRRRGGVFPAVLRCRVCTRKTTSEAR